MINKFKFWLNNKLMNKQLIKEFNFRKPNLLIFHKLAIMDLSMEKIFLFQEH